jgi:2-polyprenyl-6-methoxyphenol hydroxylase-like FAD-dependent oxidoreductase
VLEFLIIGGGIAGSTLAILLGRQGRAVGLIERDSFPREKPCGEGLMPAGVAVIERLGLKPAAGGVPFEGIRYHHNGRTVEARFPSAPGLPDYGIAQRRYRLDRLLFETARGTPGVRAQTSSSTGGLLREGGRVAGAIVDGEAIRAKLVIGADGANSRVRSLLGWNIPTARKRVGARAHFRLARGRAPERFVHVFLLDGCELYVTPLPDGEAGVALLAEASAIDAPLDAAFLEWRNQPRALAEYLDGAVQTTELMARSPLESRSRRASAPGVALLGDAAGSTDPITGGGMAQALLSAALLAGCLEGKNASDPSWMPAFEHGRRRLLRDYRRVTRLVLWLSRNPRAAALGFESARRYPALLSRLIGVSAGLCPLVGSRGAAARLLPEIVKAPEASSLVRRGQPGFQP